MTATANRSRSGGRAWRPALLAAVLAAPLAVSAATTPAPPAESGQPVLRVCADPSNLPFSNQAQQGFENRIAHLLADRLGATLDYAWYPMQMGFARRTLANYMPQEGRYSCDLIIGTTSGLEVGKTTRPYYHSSYVMLYPRGQGLDQVQSLEDLLTLPENKLRSLRIGVFAGSPVADWLVRHGLMKQAVSYKAQSGSREVTPGTIIRRDLASGDVDLMFVWGPIGGYYAQALSDCTECRFRDIAAVPLEPGPGQPYVFGIAMGVRYGNDAWLETVQGLIDDNRQQILDILQKYNVPTVEPWAPGQARR